MDELKRPIILDCDPGEDDAVCLFMLLAQDDIDILGITPVCGNKSLAHCEKNALKLLELTGRTDIPVYKGAIKPILIEERTAGATHGETGLGSVVLPEPKIKLQDEYAWDYIYRTAKELKGELEIVAIGPLTNIATALIKYPDLPEYVKRISIMGGANGLGNMTAAAEFNIWADPDAAKIVFKAGIPMVMMGLDICHNACLDLEDLDRIKAVGTKLSEVSHSFLEKRYHAGIARGGKGAIICDAVTAGYLIDPDIFEMEHVHVDVETKGRYTQGKTVITRYFTEHIRIAPNTYVGIDLDRKKFVDMMVDSLIKLG